MRCTVACSYPILGKGQQKLFPCRPDLVAAVSCRVLVVLTVMSSPMGLCIYQLSKPWGFCTCHLSSPWEFCTCHLSSPWGFCTCHLWLMYMLYLSSPVGLCTWYLSSQLGLCTLHFFAKEDMVWIDQLSNMHYVNGHAHWSCTCVPLFASSWHAW